MNDNKLNELRCKNCRKKLGADLEGAVSIVCPRCGVFNVFNRVHLTNLKISASVEVKK